MVLNQVLAWRNSDGDLFQTKREALFAEAERIVGSLLEQIVEGDVPSLGEVENLGDIIIDLREL